ncbi:ligase-associated DNA damage response endonuclease PdeM [Zunongwangia endophytica]|uniref:Ligase-associated DNA damage response endonuclease PdeM n=1 Tax=Zunongwangia endophytica TaxID=1808945 RepID=A0ABV8H7H3_9FLAO|nr:ligase-associated DNA damage response endonuclease PdeM [Zunongwangia endophytica]MDN3595733.1 ligase-associated DNA damage response endonuclease PdeM [Zunongwangia endophytica]
MTLAIQNNHFQLACNGVSYWEEQQALLVADVHLGKISHFRKNGSAVPQTAILKNFDRLNESVAQFQPKQIIFLGDLFHSALNSEWNLFENWLQQQQAEVILIAGNHDIISPLHYDELGVKIHQELNIDNFRLTHHPEEQEDSFNICGHIHPGYRLVGLGKQHLKLKCFFRSERQLILPAFGEFTGCFVMKPEPKDQVFVCADAEVIQVN